MLDSYSLIGGAAMLTATGFSIVFGLLFALQWVLPLLRRAAERWAPESESAGVMTGGPVLPTIAPHHLKALAEESARLRGERHG